MVIKITINWNMKIIAKIGCILSLLVVVYSTQAQGIYYGNGQSVKIKGKEDIEGSPYYKDDWLIGTIKMEAGNTISDMALRFDLYRNDLTYLKNDSIFVVSAPMKEFSVKEIRNGNFVTTVFKCGYASNGIMTEKTFYEVLADGNISLLRYLKVNLEKDGSIGMGQYSTSEVTKSYIRKSTLLVYDANKKVFFEVPKRDREAFLLGIVGKKKSELSRYIDKQRLNLKDEEDFAKLINYYNSLQQSGS